jgi:bifunctional ADP-heptose synthase (sugar kinase/adenylyltransferase)
VHYVILFDEPTPCELLDELRPEVLVKGGTTHDVVGEEIVKARGGLVRIVATVADISTTEIVRRVRGSG